MNGQASGEETAGAESVRWPIMVGLSLAAAACGPGFSFSEAIEKGGTIALDRQRTLIVETVVELELDGARRVDDVTWQLSGTVSASSAAAAEALARDFTIAVDDADRNRLRLTLPKPANGRIEGKWTLTTPADLDVQVVGRGPGQQVVGFDGDVAIDASVGVRVLDCAGDITVRTTGGDALVDTELNPGSDVVVDAAGSVQITVQPRPSADFALEVGPNGAIVIQHPALPQWPGNGLPYRATIFGGMSFVSVVSTRGNVIVTSQ